MPKKRPGYHNIHVIVTESNFRTLQDYCYGGTERLTATGIIELLMTTYIEDCITPRLNKTDPATWVSVKDNIPKVAAKVARKIEPTAFEKPNQ